jgi:hemoglobin
MSTAKSDISSKKDIQIMVDSFYAKVRKDPLIGPIFNDEAKVNWNEHLPKLYNFWEDLLFGTQNYHGRPFPPHLKFDLQVHHFEKWVSLFILTVDEHFVGKKAEEAKARALRIAENFLQNIRFIKAKPTLE